MCEKDEYYISIFDHSDNLNNITLSENIKTNSNNIPVFFDIINKMKNKSKHITIIQEHKDNELEEETIILQKSNRELDRLCESCLREKNNRNKKENRNELYKNTQRNNYNNYYSKQKYNNNYYEDNNTFYSKKRYRNYKKY